MSDWITDRLPTSEDADKTGNVWVTYNGVTVLWSYAHVKVGDPWQPTHCPAPYVKPKRWTVRWDMGTWVLRDRNGTKGHYVGMIELGPTQTAEAKIIEDAFNEAMP